MKVKTKPIVVASLATVCAISLFAGAGMLGKTVSAEEQNKTVAISYFGDNLKIDENGSESEYALAKKFYKALEELNATDDFKDGKIEYNITEKEIVTSDQVKAWVEGGDLTIPKAFSAARDAFLTDHPEIFYIDFYKMTISAGRSNGVYSAYIDSGREANLYYDNGFTTANEVSKAIEKFDAKVNEIVTEVKAEQAKDTYSEKDFYYAKAVNKYIATNTAYDYVTYENKDDENYIAAANVSTAYGSLVEGKAVCGGFSTGYKVIMDKLGVPCITVNGYSNQKNEEGEYQPSSVYHMWNYVYLENPVQAKSAASTRASDNGRWYSVDVTWNRGSKNKYQYAVLNEPSDTAIHVTDGVISSAKYELKYPELSKFNYGASESTDGVQLSFTYTETSNKDDYGNTLVNTRISVSYNGKSANRLLEEDGLYLVHRVADYEGGELKWGKWQALAPLKQYYDIAFMPGFMDDNGNETILNYNTSVYYIQAAVFDAEPNVPTLPIYSDKYPEYNGKVFYYEYTDEHLNESKAVEVGEPKENKSYGTYTPAPYITRSTPTHQAEHIISDSMRDQSIKDKVIMAESKAFVIEVTYDEPLHKIVDNKPITVSFVSEHPNTKEYAGFLPIDSNGTMVEIVERAKSSSDPTLEMNTLRFKFRPSLMWEHNREVYVISFGNVGSARVVSKKVNGEIKEVTSDKVPNPVGFSFGRMYMACPARFNYDGRLWVECCAQPRLADNSDLSASNFLKEDGTTSFSENERSQMMLVAEKASTETVNTMLDEIDKHDDISISKNDIKKSTTYDIDLQICGKYPTIPDGSYVKIMLGFPEGFGPEDEGVAFKLFHRKHDPKTDTYAIEEVPCVVTQFGILATVTSFSPYMVAAVDAEKVTDKTVYATIEGKGGKLNAEDGKIQSLTEGGSYTYTIVPDSGYQIYMVTLNGKDITAKIADGKLTVTYSDLEACNEIEIKYIANDAVQRVVENNIVIPSKVVVNEDNSTTKVAEVIDTPTHLEIVDNKPASSDKTLVIVISVVSVVVVLGLVVALVVVIKKRSNADIED